MKTNAQETNPTDVWTKAFRASLTEWYRCCSRDLPWRQSRDPYAIWISEIMLQQTQVDTVIPYYLRFMAALPTVSDLAQASDEVLLKLWEGLGYYSRARNLKKAAQILTDQHQGRMPEDGAALQKLPGIGPYTAGAIGSIAYGLPLAAVDGNVIRVYSRVMAVTVNADTGPGKKLFQALGEALVDPAAPSTYNQAVMELGALICTPAAPQCPRCPVSALCRAYEQGQPQAFPVRTPKAPGKILHWLVTVYRRPGEIFVISRAQETLLKGLWGFPMAPVPLLREKVSPQEAFHGFEIAGTVKHVFTHQTWIMGVRIAGAPEDGRLEEQYPDGIWVDSEALYRLPMAKAFQKVLPLIPRHFEY